VIAGQLRHADGGTLARRATPSENAEIRQQASCRVDDLPCHSDRVVDLTHL
jgi:hypothetical protein